ncbi:metallophosphoesterase [Phycicoccus sp. DTK01]|uniref:metallophosphoesterase n=1 Tax=Phycicoccus sp. DTK01 TaxID=2785745 RepID=UPI001A8D1501|nr:metallophosphoesterase [Phycicoccus sp. DTK01]GIL33938.1 metallophosphatase [Phycicoccus sp. DTK01]
MSALAALVPVVVLGGFLAFVWHRLAVAPRWGRRWVPWLLALVLAALVAAVLEQFDVWGGAWSAGTMRPVAWTGAAFLATCLYLFLGLVPVALVSGAIWLLRWRHDHGRDARRRFNRVAAPLVAALAVGLTGYGAWEASHPSATAFEVASPELPAQFDGARVALLTDLHAGAVRSAGFTRTVVDLVNAQRPDVVVIAGDLVDGTAARYRQEIAPLADLEAPLGVYVTTGNHEMYRDTANWVDEFRRLGLTVLANEHTPLERDGASITLAGVHDYSGTGPFTPDPDAALSGVDAAGFTLYAAHQPRQAFAVEGRGVDLQLSGHTHGGQLWPIRYLVPLQQPMVDGEATVAGTRVITSRGAGAWGPAVRVLAPPEVPIITLRRS